MYEELIAALRFCDGGECDGCCRYKKEHGAECYTLLRDAADAIEERDKYALTLQHEMMAEAESHIALVERLNKRIEELELHYCHHAIRNVHDRGDDSICRVLGTEPPKEETKNFCGDCHWYEAEEMYCFRQGCHTYDESSCELWEPMPADEPIPAPGGKTVPTTYDLLYEEGGAGTT